MLSDSWAKVVSCPVPTGKVKPQGVFEKIILTLFRYFSEKPCLWGHFTFECPESGQQEVPIINMDMKRSNISLLNRMKWLKTISLLIATAIGSNYLYRHGISPVWIAVAIVIVPGFFRFVYRIVCLLVSLAIIIAVIGYLIF